MRIISEQEKRQRKAAVRAARNRQIFESAGMDSESAAAAAGDAESIRAWNKGIRNARRLAVSLALGDASPGTVDAVRAVCALGMK